jgi:pyruvate/2-oxoglutarate dehydrogenase complex dihydrolipoamide acyltransferase (E2) component
MKTVYYHGPYAEGVEIALPDGTGVLAAQGEPTEVPDDVAARLLEQEIWTSSAAPPESAPAPSKKVRELAAELNVDLATVEGTNAGGAIGVGDVKKAAEAASTTSPESSDQPDDTKQPEPGATEGE